MRTLTLPLFAAPLLAAGVYAVDRRLRAARTRRQLLDALAVLPELAGVVPAGRSARVAALAHVLGERLERRERERLATVARLAPLAPAVVEAAATDVEVVRLLEEVQAAPPGRAGPAAAAVRVAATFEAHLERVPASGALFATLVEHPRGEERRAAEALVGFVQNRPSRV
ncbi:MAG TPA: hypothetical protein VHF47_12600 [Acidimicrobiales bacterium]|nr:hypothetical protein [Acidimicrobiales bacterium]